MKINAFLIDVFNKKISPITLETTATGSCYLELFHILKDIPIEIGREHKDSEYSILQIGRNHLDKIYDRIKRFELPKQEPVKEECEDEDEEENKKEPEIEFTKDEQTYPGFKFKGVSIHFGMGLGNAVFHGLDYLEESSSTNFTLEELSKHIEFKDFSKTEILYSKEKNYNFNF